MSRKSLYADGLRERLAQLAKHYKQSELAQATGVPVTNVHYYLQGRRIPAEFCAALVDRLGVNPAWLMSGEGAMLLSDVNASESERAGNLLELVQAMNAIIRMKLGALAGKDHLKVFRKLNEALVMYRELRGRLGEESKPLMQRLVKQYEDAIREYDRVGAKRLEASIEQVAELCDDDKLRTTFEQLQIVAKSGGGQVDEAIGATRKLVTRLLIGRDHADPDTMAVVFQLLDSFRVARRGYEAKELASAVLQIWSHLSHTQEYGSAMLMSGLLSMDLGDIREANVLIRGGVARVQQSHHHMYAPVLSILDLYNGTIEYQDMIETLHRIEGMGGRRNLVLFGHVPLTWTCWLEDEQAIKETLGHFAAAIAEQEVGFGRMMASHAEVLVKTLSRKRPKEVLKYFESEERQAFFDNNDAAFDLLDPLLACQLAKCAGLDDHARKLLLETDQVLKKQGGKIMTQRLLTFMHWKNAMELGSSPEADAPTAELAQLARAGIAESFNQGYGCLRDLAKLVNA